MPICPFVSLLWGKVLIALAEKLASNSKKIDSWERSYQLFQRTTNFNPDFLPAYKLWAVALKIHSSIVEGEGILVVIC